MTKNGGWNAVNEQLKAKELEKRVVEEMTRMVRHLLTKTVNDGLQWSGAKADLLEMLKLVSDKGSIISDDGMPVDFISLTRRVFDIFNEKMISNPYTMAVRGAKRMGIRKKSLKDRLKYVMMTDDNSKINVFWNTLIIKAV